MIKKTITACMCFFTINANACCDCAIVEGAMGLMNSTFEASIKTYDENSSKTYENNILAKLNNSMQNLNTNFSALKSNTLLESMNSICGDEISHEIKKSIELKSIEKTQKAIFEFEKK